MNERNSVCPPESALVSVSVSDAALQAEMDQNPFESKRRTDPQIPGAFGCCYRTRSWSHKLRLITAAASHLQNKSDAWFSLLYKNPTKPWILCSAWLLTRVKWKNHRPSQRSLVPKPWAAQTGWDRPSHSPPSHDEWWESLDKSPRPAHTTHTQTYIMSVWRTQNRSRSLPEVHFNCVTHSVPSKNLNY